MGPGTKMTQYSVEKRSVWQEVLPGGSCFCATGRLDRRQDEEMQFLERLQRHRTMQPLKQGSDLVLLQMQSTIEQSSGPTRRGPQPTAFEICRVPIGWCAQAFGSRGIVKLRSARRSNMPTLHKSQWEFRWELAILCKTSLKRGKREFRMLSSNMYQKYTA